MKLSSQKRIVRRPSVSTLPAFETPIPDVLARVYATRGVQDEENLQLRLDRLLSPRLLKGIDVAAALLADAVMQQQRVLIVGDFDADGATSCTLAVLALKAMGIHFVDYLVPNRFDYGYGLTPEIVAVAAGQKPDIIVTVDNGISSIEGVSAAQERGIKVIVTDHHLPGQTMPTADAIVNPNQPGCDFPSKALAGVGVIFYVMTQVRAVLREQKWFEQNNIPQPNMAEYLDLVALGTVADVVPLDFNNRILVQQGLLRIRSGRARQGIMALLEVGRRNYHNMVASDLGFAVGPRLNAAGRLDDISLGIQCLLCDSAPLAREMAIELDDLNKERKHIEASMQAEALQAINSLSLTKEDKDLPWGLCLYNPTWHQGVIGIVASRIKERVHRPVIAFAEADDNTIKGSARSIEGLHIRDALDEVAAQHPELLQKFGGHAMAAGLTLARDDFPAFQACFDQVVRSKLNADALEAQALTDGELEECDLSLTLAQVLRDAGPWGQHFPEPLFDGEFHIVQQRIVGEKHLKMTLTTREGGQILFDAIAFNVDLDTWPSDTIKKAKLVYKLDVNEYQGDRNLQLMVDYLEPSA